ncbi:MAG TPA: FadR/GntR family transcriptional regulator [Pirellulales bacterium]|nr:FadR/GntR family transcriptional regulator [Pirellulales bacterium]
MAGLKERSRQSSSDRYRSRRLTPVDRPDMVSEVLRQLSDQIMSGVFGPGGALPPEGALAETFGVSRTVVREAMRTLRAQGLVEVSQGKLPRVKPADPEAATASLALLLRRSAGTLLDLVEARRPLESEIALLAAERATPEDCDRLSAAIDHLVAARTLDDRVEADVQFHRTLGEATGNPVFCLMLETIAGLLRESRRQTLAQSGTEIAAQGHRAVLDAVRRGEGAAAKAAMLEHLNLAERDLRAADDKASPRTRRT